MDGGAEEQPRVVRRAPAADGRRVLGGERRLPLGERGGGGVERGGGRAREVRELGDGAPRLNLTVEGVEQRQPFQHLAAVVAEPLLDPLQRGERLRLRGPRFGDDFVGVGGGAERGGAREDGAVGEGGGVGGGELRLA